MTHEEIMEWLSLEENKKIFPPTNSHPTQEQRTKMFEIANYLDPRGNHKPSSCGRCFYNARTAVMKALTIF